MAKLSDSERATLMDLRQAKHVGRLDAATALTLIDAGLIEKVGWPLTLTPAGEALLTKLQKAGGH